MNDRTPDRTNAAEFTVSEIAQALKRTVEDEFGHVRVRGEISGFRGQHSSGHAYFTLKDEGAVIDAVIWKGNWGKLAFKPAEGLEVIATGRLTTYPKSSKYQIVIEDIKPAGAGALMALLEERRRKLQAEGLFAAERKQLLPTLPRVIGVVTSPTGAVIRDILHRIADRFPSHVLVWPVRVQGETAAAEVAAAIEGFNALTPDGAIPRPDILIVARGGGSIEDLWAFNEEILVRAVANSDIPVISAVGHETDTTLCDFAADLRAPTPTAAAEAAVPVRIDLLEFLRGLHHRLGLLARGNFKTLADRFTNAKRLFPTGEEVLAWPMQALDQAAVKLQGSLTALASQKRLKFTGAASRLSVGLLVKRQSLLRQGLTRWSAGLATFPRRLTEKRQKLEAQGRLLDTLSYREVLRRGYAIVENAEGEIIRSAASIAPGEALLLRLADGEAHAVASGEAAPAPKKRAAKDPVPGGGQESLF